MTWTNGLFSIVKFNIGFGMGTIQILIHFFSIMVIYQLILNSKWFFSFDKIIDFDLRLFPCLCSLLISSRQWATLSLIWKVFNNPKLILASGQMKLIHVYTYMAAIFLYSLLEKLSFTCPPMPCPCILPCEGKGSIACGYNLDMGKGYGTLSLVPLSKEY